MNSPRSGSRLVRAISTMLLLISPCSTIAAPVHLTPERDLVWKDFLGVNAHFLWFPKSDYQTQILRYKELGLEWVRVDLHWDTIEPKKGQYKWKLIDPLINLLDDQQLHSVFYLVGSAPFATTAPEDSATPDQYPPSDPQLFANRMVTLAKRYPGIDAWQVWNEPNLPSFWRPQEDPAGYWQLLNTTARALHARAPGRDVVTGGMAYYSQMPVVGGLMLQSLLEMGLPELDTVVAYHPYSELPEGELPSGSLDMLPAVKQINSALRSSGIEQIWATEWGWSSYDGPKELQAIIGEDGQADYTLRRLVLMSALDFDRVFLFALSDLDERASARDQHYGLLDIDGEPKPVYTALKYFLDVTGPNLHPGTPPVIINTPDDLYSVTWTRKDGKQLMLFWSDSGGRITLPNIQEAVLHNPMTQTHQTLIDRDGIQLPTLSSLQMLVW